MNVTLVRDPVVQRFLEAYYGGLVAAYGPEHVILFGSRATGAPREDSDIDLLVVSERFREVRLVNRRYHLKTELDWPPRVDVLCYTPEEFEQLRDGFGLVADICREGIWLL